MAVVQLAVMLNWPTASRASPRPRLMVVGHKVCVRRRSLVGAGLLAKAMVQSAVMLNVPPSSRASPLPQLMVVGHRICVHQRFPVGASLLAMAVVQLAVMLNVPTASRAGRSEEHTSELQSLMRISYAIFCLKKKTTITHTNHTTYSV